MLGEIEVGPSGGVYNSIADDSRIYKSGDVFFVIVHSPYMGADKYEIWATRPDSGSSRLDILEYPVWPTWFPRDDGTLEVFLLYRTPTGPDAWHYLRYDCHGPIDHRGFAPSADSCLVADWGIVHPSSGLACVVTTTGNWLWWGLVDGPTGYYNYTDPDIQKRWFLYFVVSPSTMTFERYGALPVDSVSFGRIDLSGARSLGWRQPVLEDSTGFYLLVGGRKVPGDTCGFRYDHRPCHYYHDLVRFANDGSIVLPNRTNSQYPRFEVSDSIGSVVARFFQSYPGSSNTYDRDLVICEMDRLGRLRRHAIRRYPGLEDLPKRFQYIEGE